ncbi:nickel-dependent hydrogenase large subunit [Candidatus Giovannonibacteria bacterium]|nr:nickel-dependent hydrogenase large subunit [Candidatus Giovannonibacteria bacterium]
MHNNFDLTLDRLTKVEGSASLEIRVRENRVEHVHFKITEFKRFFTKAMEGKPVIALPQLLSRICGTCSNAHILASIEACENALGIKPSEQTMALRALTMYGLNIRDHALHLYLFAMPDIFGKDAFLDFDENDPIEGELLNDAFEIKAAGNFLSTLVAGRSVHALYPNIGGFNQIPGAPEIKIAIEKLEAIRPAVIRLVKVFENSPFHFDRNTNFMALVPKDRYGFIDGDILTSKGERVPEKNFREHLERVVLPYSQASAYKHEGEAYMVGALSRMNLAKDLLHPRTKETLATTLNLFPSTDVFYTNIAQTVEILHSIDDAIEILQNRKFEPEALQKGTNREAVGVGVVEAPRGTLYHMVKLKKDGTVESGEVIVPTGQNQVNIEEDVARLVEDLIPESSKEEIVFEIEKLIRAYDPCMSCAAHFLKVDWK